MEKLTYKNIQITEEMRQKTSEFWTSHSNPQIIGDDNIFYSGCFCILAPQAKFKNNSKIVEELRKRDFFHNKISFEQLAVLCVWSRFYNVKARRLIEFKNIFPNILDIIKSNRNSYDMRELLVKHVKGFGMKAASHFLRNIGKQDVAILDTHIFKFLECNSPKTKRAYLRMEERLCSIAENNELTVGSLDLIIWKHYANVSWEEYIY